MREQYRLPLLKSGSLRCSAIILGLVTAAVTVSVQAAQESSILPAEVTGRYEGLAHSKSYGEVPLVVEIRNEKTRISGSLHTPLGDFSITEATFSNGNLIFKAESYDDEGVVSLRFRDGRFVGEFDGFGNKGHDRAKEDWATKSRDRHNSDRQSE
jgi:hypothetical protein